MNIKMYKIEDLKPAYYNPRYISEEQFKGLKTSISTFGLVDPIVHNVQTGNIVSGHMRLRACMALGWVQVPVCEVDLSLEKEKMLNITMNNAEIQGRFDMSILPVLMDELESCAPTEFKELRLADLEDSLKDAAPRGRKKTKKLHTCPNCGNKFEDDI